MENTFVLKNVLLPDFETLTTKPVDIYVENGTFAQIAPKIPAISVPIYVDIFTAKGPGVDSEMPTKSKSVFSSIKLRV